MKQEIRFCTSPDGVKIAFAVTGQGPVLVKAANWLGHLEYERESPVWRHWLRDLSKYHTLVRYDERGCGLSDREVKDFSIDAWVNDLETVVDTLNLNKFPLLGISQGGAVAISFAVKHPEKVSHLILYGAYAQGRKIRNFSKNEAEQHNALTTFIKIGWGQDNPAFRQVFANLFMPEASAEILGSFAELQRISTSPENASRFHEVFGNINVLELLPKVNVPTLVLHSSNDSRIPPEAGRQLASMIPNSKFVLLPSKNHILLENEHAWQRFLSEVYEFLDIRVENNLPASHSANNKANSSTISIGQTIAHYKIIDKLGAGGMGVVYKAEDSKLKRLVALKFLPSELTQDEVAKQRFILEAQTASALDHPNICTIYEIGETDKGQMYISMASYEGLTLKEKIEQSSLKTEEITDIAIQISEGLQRAHEAGMIHRDIKPGNIIITTRGEVKILDFGLAKNLGGQSKLTKTGMIAGTIYYMSPEQINEENIDHRTDIWSLGVLLYEAVTGTLPFKGEYEQATIYSILNEQPKPLENFRNDIPEDLEKIINKALRKNPSDRYQSMGEIISDLKKIKGGLLENRNSLKGNSELPATKDYRRLSAIMFTDMVGYSALTQKNEELALELLKEHREILRPVFSKHNGDEIETAGDSFFVEFVSTLDAVKCAIEIQKLLHERNQNVPDERKIVLRIGLHVGDVVHMDNHVHGDGVNLAARLEPLASPGCICVSEDVARQVQSKIDYPIVKVGKKKLKNIRLPMNVYKIALPWETKGLNTGFLQKFKQVPLLKNPLVLLTAFVLLFFGIGYFVSQNSKGDLTTGLGNRIAVLPFDNISPDTEDDYFADGITEEIISNLAKISGLDVIARTSIIKYKTSNLDAGQIGNELNVGTILEGSVRRAANKTRITVQLIDTKTQKHLWSETYDRELKDIFAVQSDIAMKVAEELKIQLLANEKEQIEKAGTENSDALRNYLLGNYFLNRRTGESLNKGIESFTRAIEYDPDFALAYAGLANCYTLLGGAAYGNLSREDASVKANEAVLKALDLDPTLAEAHASLGYIKFRFDWRWNEAEKEFKRAIELKPGYAQAHEWYSLFLSLIRRNHDKALSEMKRAYDLDPLSPSISTGVGRILHIANSFEKAVLQYKKTLDMYPNYAEAHFALAMTYASQRKIEEAFGELEKAIELSHGRMIMITTRGMLHGFAGNKKEALAVLDDLEELSYPDEVSPWAILSIYLSIDDKDKFFEYSYKALEEKDALMVYFPTMGIFNPSFNDDPRFQDILHKMGLD